MKYTEAKDTTWQVFYQALLASSPGLIGYIPEVYWDGVEENSKPPIDKYYVRANFQVIDSPQRAFVSCPGVNSKRLFSNDGIATFTIHAPSFESDAKRNSELLAESLQTAFRRQNEVWFRNPMIGNPYVKGHFLRTTMTVEINFTEVD